MKPKLLLLTVSWNYVNKTTFVFFEALRNYFDITKYGPGFVNTDELDVDILDILEKFKETDLIVIDEILIFKKLNPINYKFVKKINRFYFNLQNYINKKKSFPLNLNKVKIPVFVSLLMSDYYNFSKEQIDIIRGLSNPYYICWGEDFILPREKTQYLNEEFHSHVNDNVASFVRKYEERIIPMQHMVDKQEFLDFSQKSVEWCVPGASYYWRREVKNLLKKERIQYKNYSFINHAIQKLDASNIIKLTHYDWLMYLYYKTYREVVNRSWCSFTCGSGLKYPVRKFFEIPAFSSLLVCNPCASFSELGFKDSENCFTANTLEEFEGVIKKVKDKDMVKQMTLAGQRLVREKHTAQVRARQFFNIYNTIAQDNFLRAYWSKGDIWYQGKNYEMTVT